MADTKDQAKSSISWSQSGEAHLIKIWGDEYIRIGKGNLGKHNWEAVCNELNKKLGGKEGMLSMKHCRQKIDSLKKRYKDELGKKSSTGSVNTTWIHFDSMASFLAGSSKMTGIPGSCDSSAPAALVEEFQIPKSNERSTSSSLQNNLTVEIQSHSEEDTPLPAAPVQCASAIPNTADVHSNPQETRSKEASKESKSKEDSPQSPVTAFNQKFAKNPVVSGKGNEKRKKMLDNKLSPRNALAKEFGNFVKVFADLGQKGLDLEERLANNQMKQQSALAERSEKLNMELAQMKMQLQMDLAKMNGRSGESGSRKRARESNKDEGESANYYYCVHSAKCICSEHNSVI
jgi:hypothetical protein